MKLIKYFNKVILQDNLTKYADINKYDFKVEPFKYKCKDNEFEYWLDIIEKSYGQYGEVTSEDIPDMKTSKEVLTQIIANLTIENKRKDALITQLAQQISNLNIKINQMEVK